MIKFIIIGLLTAFILGGCSTASKVAVSGALEESAETLKYAHDRKLEVSIFSFCGTPYSTLVRNSVDKKNIAEAAKALCGEL